MDAQFLNDDWSNWSLKDEDNASGSQDASAQITVKEIAHLHQAQEACHKVMQSCKRTCSQAAGKDACAALVAKAKDNLHKLQQESMKAMDDLLWSDRTHITTGTLKQTLQNVALEMANIMQIEKELKAVLRTQ